MDKMIAVILVWRDGTVTGITKLSELGNFLAQEVEKRNGEIPTNIKIKT